MKSKKISVNANGTETWLHIDEGDGRVYYQDYMHPNIVQAILDKNQAIRNNENNKSAIGRHGASIPLPMWHNWKQEYNKNAKHIMSWQEFLKRKLNDREFEYLRTGAGKL